MRTLEQIDADIWWERNGLRRSAEIRDSAAEIGDETTYETSAKDCIACVAKIDQLRDERNGVLFCHFEDRLQVGRFASRFQSVEDDRGYWCIADTKTRRIVRTDIPRKACADGVCAEMSDYTRSRESSLARQDRSVFREQNRTINA
jgi:hypothetical protein